MKKKIATIILTVILLTTCMAMFCACTDEEPEPRDVVLELVNPTTGEAVKDDDTIDLPTEKTRIKVRIKDKETGEYLTDNDLPENTVQGSYKVQFIILDNDGYAYRQEGYTYWPTKEDIESLPYYNYYEMQISFDCKPSNIVDSKFQRKYKMETDYVRFYINKPWRDGDDRYNQ